MTKDELKKEADEWLRSTDNHLNEEKTRFLSESEYAERAYLASAEPREKQIQIDAEQIRALQKQNGELTDELTKKANTNHQLIEQMAELNERCSELEAQNEKMKCCGNCENGELSAHEEPCLHCQRCFASMDVTDQENVKDYWEAIKEIKEND